MQVSKIALLTALALIAPAGAYAADSKLVDIITNQGETVSTDTLNNAQLQLMQSRTNPTPPADPQTPPKQQAAAQPCPTAPSGSNEPISPECLAQIQPAAGDDGGDDEPTVDSDPPGDDSLNDPAPPPPDDEVTPPDDETPPDTEEPPTDDNPPPDTEEPPTDDDPPPESEEPPPSEDPPSTDEPPTEEGPGDGGYQSGTSLELPAGPDDIRIG